MSIEQYIAKILRILLPDSILKFMQRCLERGVELKWFGGEEPNGFTSRYDSWKYLNNPGVLPKTIKVLSTTLDMRIPLTFSTQDCNAIAEIIVDESTP